jgi:hypothetical protein
VQAALPWLWQKGPTPSRACVCLSPGWCQLAIKKTRKLGKRRLSAGMMCIQVAHLCFESVSLPGDWLVLLA